MTDIKKDPQVQGEGDYQAARRHRRGVEEFVAENDEADIEDLARDAAPRSEAEQRELLEAEREGRARARGRKPGKNPIQR